MSNTIVVRAGNQRVVSFPRSAVPYAGPGIPFRLTGPMPVSTDRNKATSKDAHTDGDPPIELDIDKMDPIGAHAVRRLIRSGDLVVLDAAEIAKAKAKTVATPNTSKRAAKES